MAAKAQGAWNLHQLSENMTLDFMVFFSSISALVGNAGQANYVAANNFLDQLAHYRRSQGLQGLSINWGVFEETGVVARNDQLAKHLSHIGITPFSSNDAVNALQQALNWPGAQLGIMNVNWQRFESLLKEGAGKSRFKLLAGDNAEPGQEDAAIEHLKATFGELEQTEREEVLREALRLSVASVMRLDADKVKPSDSLRDLGLDSLMAVEIDVAFSTRTGLEIPTADIASGPTLAELESRLAKRLASILPVKPATETEIETA